MGGVVAVFGVGVCDGYGGLGFCLAVFGCDDYVGVGVLGEVVLGWVPCVLFSGVVWCPDVDLVCGGSLGC